MKMYIDLTNVSEYEFARLQGLCFSRGIYWRNNEDKIVQVVVSDCLKITDFLVFDIKEKITHTIAQAMEEIEKLPIDYDRVLTPFSKNKEDFVGWGGKFSNSYDGIVLLKDSPISLLGSISKSKNSPYKDLLHPHTQGGEYENFLPLYPPKPPEPKANELMTHRQLSEWLARGNGQSLISGDCYRYSCHEYDTGDDEPVEDYFIRPWDSDEWVKPTVDIYNRDCRGVKE